MYFSIIKRAQVVGGCSTVHVTDDVFNNDFFSFFTYSLSNFFFFHQDYLENHISNTFILFFLYVYPDMHIPIYICIFRYSVCCQMNAIL